MADFIRLIILILFLPLIIIFIGPFLVLAVVRGSQQMGPITLDSTRYDFVGRAGMFMMGLAIWLLVWSGLVWLAIAATASAPVLVQVPTASPIATASPVAVEPVIEPVVTLTPPPATPPAANTSTPTPASPTPTPASPTPIPTPTLGPIIPAIVNTPGSTATPTPLFDETLPVNTPSADTSAIRVKPAIEIALSSSEQQAALAAVDQANVLLQNAVTLASEENLENLAIVWRGRALVGMRIFAARLSERYTQPFTAQFEYITPPTITAQNSPNQIVITSQEKWNYGWLSNVDQDLSEFTYTLEQIDEAWFITRYSYRELSLPTPTTVAVDDLATITPTTPQN